MITAKRFKNEAKGVSCPMLERLCETMLDIGEWFVDKGRFLVHFVYCWPIFILRDAIKSEISQKDLRCKAKPFIINPSIFHSKFQKLSC